MENANAGGSTAPKKNNKCPVGIRLILIFVPIICAGLSLFFAISELLSHEGRVNAGENFGDYGNGLFRVLAIIFAVLTVVFFVLQFVLPKAVFKKRVVAPGIVFNSISMVAGIVAAYMGGSLLGTHNYELVDGADSLVRRLGKSEEGKEGYEAVNPEGRDAILPLVETYGALQTDVRWTNLAYTSGETASATYEDAPALKNYTDYTAKVRYTSEWSKDGKTCYYRTLTEWSSKYDVYLGDFDIDKWASEHKDLVFVENDNDLIFDGKTNGIWTTAYGTHKDRNNGSIKPIYPSKYDYYVDFSYSVKATTGVGNAWDHNTFLCRFDKQNKALRISFYGWRQA